jgi:hypothetical protein
MAARCLSQVAHAGGKKQRIKSKKDVNVNGGNDDIIDDNNATNVHDDTVDGENKSGSSLNIHRRTGSSRSGQHGHGHNDEKDSWMIWIERCTSTLIHLLLDAAPSSSFGNALSSSIMMNGSNGVEEMKSSFLSEFGVLELPPLPDDAISRQWLIARRINAISQSIISSIRQLMHRSLSDGSAGSSSLLYEFPLSCIINYIELCLSCELSSSSLATFTGSHISASSFASLLPDIRVCYWHPLLRSVFCFVHHCLNE